MLKHEGGRDNLSPAHTLNVGQLTRARGSSVAVVPRVGCAYLHGNHRMFVLLLD